MTASNRPRGICPGKPEGELRRDRSVQVRSFDAKRCLAYISDQRAAELVGLHLCSEKCSVSGKRLYLRLLIRDEDMPKQASIASLITVRHVQGPRTIQSQRGANYYEHRFPDLTTTSDRTRKR